MATYAIGDIQGCFTTLQRLLRRVGFDPAQDRLWLVGDLVNRGPDSLATLRWASHLGDRVVAVLGNHDLHLLARAAGLVGSKRRDTLDDVLQAPDRDALIDWLRSRPLLHREGDVVMVHAGLLPQWTVDDAEARARQCEAILRGPEVRKLLTAVADARKTNDPTLAGLAQFVGALTRLRTCTLQGEMCTDFSGVPEKAPPGCVPWYQVPGRKSADHTVVFGHWAAHGAKVGPGIVATDSGCVWGNALTAVRLEDRQLFSEPAERLR